MEKGIAENGMKIVVTGPESTGKSTLAAQLAEHFQGLYVPEFARSYVENLQRPYEYTDVEYIARKQVNEMVVYSKKQPAWLFFDTYLEITKVWFDVVYGSCPAWVTDNLQNSHVDLFLVCDTDLPWIPDSVRENGGEMREQLLKLYIEELVKRGFKFRMVRGSGAGRLQAAIGILRKEFGV